MNRQAFAAIGGGDRDGFVLPVRRAIVRAIGARLERRPIVLILLRVDAIERIRHRLLTRIVAERRWQRGAERGGGGDLAVLHAAKPVGRRSIEGRPRVRIQELIIRIVPCAAEDVAGAVPGVVPDPLPDIARHVNGAISAEPSGRCRRERSRAAKIRRPGYRLAEFGTRGVRPVINRRQPLAPVRRVGGGFEPADARDRMLLLTGRRAAPLPGGRPGPPGSVAEDRHRLLPLECLAIT